MQGEIGRRSSGDNVLEREGYAVAAGCALGLVALGELLAMKIINLMHVLHKSITGIFMCRARQRCIWLYG